MNNRIKGFLTFFGFILSLSMYGQIQNYTGTPQTAGCSSTSGVFTPFPHTVEFEGVIYDFPNAGQSTWLYKLSSLSGKKVNAISHTSFPINLSCVNPASNNDGIMVGHYVNNKGTYSFDQGAGFPTIVNPDPKTGIVGLKFDEGFNTNQTKYYFYVLDSKPSLASTNMAVKAGKNSYYTNICGPDVFASVPISLTGLDGTYESDDAAITFSIDPQGAVVSGPGISGNTFDPHVAGGGTHVIDITYTQANGCGTQDDTIIVNVNCSPKSLSIIGLDTHYFMYDESVPLTGSPAGGTFSGPGVIGNNFKANQAGLGEHYVYYTYYDAPNCTWVDSSAKIIVECCDVPILVEGLPQGYDITGEKPNNFEPIVLKAYPRGGEFITTSQGLTVIVAKSDSAVAHFDPYIAGPGNHTIEYTLGDESCTTVGSIFVESEDNQTLSVQMISFQAVEENDAVKIHWKTLTETNNDRFILEKTTDLINFEIIEEVKGSGTSYDLNEYTSYDHSGINGQVYYRLSQVDYGGTTTIVGISLIEGTTNIPLEIVSWTNDNQQISINYKSTHRENIMLEVYSTTGSLVYQEEIQNNDTEQANASINLSSFEKGIYLVRLRNSKTSVALKFYL